uniref:Reverse transcriptase/retrotransposon-derived protein RNase H-like domain-containing protein n=1 Tax=Sparus aurata TaxID=8175 RepID=A0A671VYZ5_SPAAU
MLKKAQLLQTAIYDQPVVAHDEITSSVLAFPDYTRPVLTQPFGGKQRPIAYYSSKLDKITKAMPPCLQAVQAAALSVESKKQTKKQNERLLLWKK